MKRIMMVLAVLVILPAANAFAQHEHMAMEGKSSKMISNEGIGIVESVDHAKGFVTITHEPIANLNWPAMTMDFAVEDTKIYSSLKIGKRVRFQFINRLGRYVVTGARPE